MPKTKHSFPVSNVRHFLEPGPIVLLSSQWQGQHNIMTLGWHMVMEFTPSLIGCVISSANHSFDLVRNSGECVINLPDASMVDVVVGIGNCRGTEVDKFEHFGLTPAKASSVQAPLIEQCHANFECRLHDDAMIEGYNLFIFEVLKAHVAERPAQPETLHYQGMGQFMLSGKSIDRRRLFKSSMLT